MRYAAVGVCKFRVCMVVVWWQDYSLTLDCIAIGIGVKRWRGVPQGDHHVSFNYINQLLRILQDIGHCAHDPCLPSVYNHVKYGDIVSECRTTTYSIEVDLHYIVCNIYIRENVIVLQLRITIL